MAYGIYRVLRKNVLNVENKPGVEFLSHFFSGNGQGQRRAVDYNGMDLFPDILLYPPKKYIGKNQLGDSPLDEIAFLVRMQWCSYSDYCNIVFFRIVLKACVMKVISQIQ